MGSNLGIIISFTSFIFQISTFLFLFPILWIRLYPNSICTCNSFYYLTFCKAYHRNIHKIFRFYSIDCNSKERKLFEIVQYFNSITKYTPDYSLSPFPICSVSIDFTHLAKAAFFRGSPRPEAHTDIVEL